MFKRRSCGLTPATKTTGTRTVTDNLKGRVVETSLTDLSEESRNPDQTFRKIKLVVEEIKGSSCYTNFHSMDVTRDKLCSLFSKRQTTIETFVDVKTKDDYFLRVFAICMTDAVGGQRCATSYATTSKIKLIRKKMSEVLMKLVQQNTLKTLVPLLTEKKIEDDIKASCGKYYPLKHVLIRKVKMLKKPKFDATKMNEFYGEKAGATTDILDVVAADEVKNLISEEAS
eukprot:TRINITY_DN0_c344_g1_i7.p2 TRINITY_DN0_c344_g1~~TRINITY_DN0_c344_g1_i7.p2  ORF type:complete len:228 (-),score=80.51 TRINITY_DN0_c344_g1_i7:58-741(-)